MSDKISRRDFLKLSAGGVLGLTLQNIPELEVKLPESLTQQFSEILVDWSNSTFGNEREANLFAIDSLTSRVKDTFSYSSGKVSQKVIANIEKHTHQKIKTFSVEWIAEYNRPVVHATTRPDIESAIIRTDSETDMFGQTEQKVFFAFSSTPDEIKIFDITSLEKINIELHKGGVITTKYNAPKKEVTEIYKIENGTLKRFMSFDKQNEAPPNSSHNNVRFQGSDKNKPARDMLVITGDDQVGILIFEKDKPPHIKLLSSKNDLDVQLTGYNPKIVLSPLGNEHTNDFFALGKNIGYFELTNQMSDSEVQLAFRFLTPDNNSQSVPLVLKPSLLNFAQAYGYKILFEQNKSGIIRPNNNLLGHIYLQNMRNEDSIFPFIEIFINNEGVIRLEESPTLTESINNLYHSEFPLSMHRNNDL